MSVAVSSHVENVSLAVLEMKEAKVSPTTAEARASFLRDIEGLIASKAGEEETKKAVRNMLRFGKYKPSGRGKPASEYLAEAAAEKNFPFINNFVDGLNFVSFKYGLPISLIDTRKAGTEEFLLRRGRTGESYVFNASGQELGLEDLLCVASREGDDPFATPVKDCQKTKSGPESTELAAFIYAPEGLMPTLEEAARELQAIYAAMAGKVLPVPVAKALPNVTI